MLNEDSIYRYAWRKTRWNKESALDLLEQTSGLNAARNPVILDVAAHTDSSPRFHSSQHPFKGLPLKFSVSESMTAGTATSSIKLISGLRA